MTIIIFAIASTLSYIPHSLHYVLVNGAVDYASLGGLELMCNINITLVSTQTELAFQL